MTTSADPVPRRTPRLRERAYEQFTRQLFDRRIVPGQFVSQRELVELTGLPLGAIRELIPRLEADGLITTVPQRGMQVAPVDLSLIRNAFQLRAFLECEAIAIFTANSADAQIAAIRAEHEEVLALALQSTTPELRDRAQKVDLDFHNTIIDSLGNEIISEVYRVNTIKIRLIRQAETRLNEEIIVPVIREHLGVIDAIETRDPAEARHALERHINAARSRALGIA